MSRIQTALSILVVICASNIYAAELPETGLFVDVKSRMTDLFTLNVDTTGPTLDRFATESDPLTLGEKLVGTDSVSIGGLMFTDGMARSGLSTGLGVSGYSALPMGLLPEEQQPRRSRVDASAKHVRHFYMDSNEGNFVAARVGVDIFLHGELTLNRLVPEALAAPNNNTLFAFVSIETTIQAVNPDNGQLIYIDGLYETALLSSTGLTLSNGFQDPAYNSPGFPDAGGGGWEFTQTADQLHAEVDWLAKLATENASVYIEPSIIVPVDTPLSITYELSITTFTSFDSFASNAAGWESIAEFGNTATMGLRSLTEGAELIEITPLIVPEPTSLALLCLAAPVFLRRRPVA